MHSRHIQPMKKTACVGSSHRRGDRGADARVEQRGERKGQPENSKVERVQLKVADGP